MQNIYNSFKTHKKYVLIGLCVLAIVAFFVLKNGKNSLETYTVAKTNVEQSVVLSGKIETTDKADLGFAASGRLAKILVKNNQIVNTGTILAQLEIGDLLADLKIKQANSKSSDVDLESAKDELEKITAQENTKVASAYRTLLTKDLVLVPEDNDYVVAAPTLGGIYDGVEGRYKVSIEKDNVTLSEVTLRTFNLEKTEKIINESGTTKLGTRGLYVSFPDDELASYLNTTWYLDIPNKAGSSYLANFNAYNEAKNDRDLAIKNAQADYEKLLTKGDDGSTVAQAEIQKINAEIRKNTIYAPFNGRVTNIEKEVGENAGVGEQVITVLGEDRLEVVLQVSELDVSKLVPGLPIEILIDAFPAEIFSGVLKTINSRETKVDGVPVYEAFVELAPDLRIKTGMNAKGTVTLTTRNNVLAVPSYLIEKKDNVATVEVNTSDGKIETRIVTLGLTGTNSLVEITSGLNEGEKVVVEALK